VLLRSFCFLSVAEGDRELIARYCGPKPRAAPYVPVLLPGARLPHFNLRIMAPGKLNISKEKTKPAAGMVSSLDGVSVLRPQCGHGLLAWRELGVEA